MKSGALNSLTVSGRQSLLVCVAAALMLLTFVTLQKFPVVLVSSPAPRLHELPLHIGTWQGTEKNLDQELVTALGTDDWMLRVYRQDPDTFVWLYIGYYADLLGFSNHHSPEACYPAQGWKLMQNDFQQIDIPGGRPILVQRLVAQKGLQQRLVLYWHQAGERVLTERAPRQRRWLRVVKAYRLKFAAMLHPTPLQNDRAFVRVSAPIRDSIETTLSHEIAFIQKAFPILTSHLTQNAS